MRVSPWPLAVLLPGLVAFAWADLRPRELRRASEPELEARAQTGRDLLQEVARAHGGEAFARFATMSVEATDTWEASGSWWPGDVQRFEAHRILDTFDSRVTLLDGDQAGTEWGLQAWHPWRGSPPEFRDSDQAIEFYLPTLQYFDELAFRLPSAEHVLEAGISKSGHQRVFVTWGALDAHSQADHYVVYIDPETHRIDRVSYTIREARDFVPWVLRGAAKTVAVGTMHYRDVRPVQGVLVSFDQVVTLGHGEKSRPPEDRVFHRLRVHRATFDQVEASDIWADPSRPTGDGSKPSESDE